MPLTKPSPVRVSVPPAAAPRVYRPAGPIILVPQVTAPMIQPKDGNRLPETGYRQQGKHVTVVVVQPKFAPAPKILHAGQKPACRFASLPQFGQAPAIVQAKTAYRQPKFYPNLNPAAAALKVDPTEFMRLESGFDESYYRMRRGGDHGLLVPNSRFIFVRTLDGDMVMHQRYRHPVLAQGRPVLYAGEASFNNGRLDWWSNGSGNYRPDSEHAEQAALPMERFFTYQDVLKGRHQRQ